jgi:hypothetical protein
MDNIDRELKLYANTRDKTFTVEDFRDLKLNFGLTPNEIGTFFRRLSVQGKIKAVGVTKATHKSANGRWVYMWRWTQ